MDQARPQTTQESKVKETNVQNPLGIMSYKL